MKIRIILIGKNKDQYLDEVMDEFLKRLRPYADVEFTILKEVSPSATFTKEKTVEAEGQQILKSLSPDDFLCVLDEHGKNLDSREFSDLLKKHKDLGQAITFVIGGAFGLSEEVKSRANLLLSFSKMTFTHQMIRIFLVEQIYRGVCIFLGKEYHNE
jgi:23S rRNA (pseudouridine1915-N3)-methyltransferase